MHASHASGPLSTTRRGPWARLPFAFLAVALLATAGCSSNPRARAKAALVRDNPHGVTQPAVVTILPVKHGSFDLGTGFFVAPDRVVTAEHVMLGAQSARVRFADGREIPIRAVLGSEASVDLVLLQVDPQQSVSPLPLAAAPPPNGARVSTVGSPGGRAQTIRYGRVLSQEITTTSLDAALLLSIPVTAGTSGSPVLDADGRVVGVVAQSTGEGKRSVAIPISRLARMERRPVAIAPWTAAADRERQQSGEAALARIRVLADAERPQEVLRQLRALEGRIDSPYLDAVASYRRGVALAETGRYDQSIDAYRAALSVRPRFASAHSALAHAYDKLGRQDESLAAYRDAIRLNPGDARAHANVGGILGELERLPEATHALQTAVRLDPDYAAAYVNLGAVLGMQGRLHEAVAALEHSVALDPRSADAHYNLGYAYVRSGRMRDAHREHGILTALNARVAATLLSVIRGVPCTPTGS